MMKRKLAFIICLMLVLSVAALFGLNASVTLDYFEGGVYVDTPKGEHFEGPEITAGFEVPIGSTISTEANGYAELLVSDSSVIKIDANTTFKISKLKGASGSTMNVFEITYGKFTAVIKKALSSDNSYEFTGNASVCGVRGTSLSMWIRTNDKSGKEEESAYTIDGDVDYWKKSAPDKKISLPRGKFANAFDDILKPIDIPGDMIADFNKKLAFDPKGNLKKLAGEEGTPEPTKAPEEEQTPTPTPEPKKENGGSGTATGGSTGNTGTGSGGEKGSTNTTGGQGGEMPEWLSKLLGLEIGSITIGETTYAKAVLQPAFTIDKLSMALYLPIIYQKNLFDPALWYKPEGNNEWSFGFDQNDVVIGIGDFVSDLFLKIKYVQWGSRFDPFFFKLGNLDTFTLGHGLLMRNYANDAEFPAVRKVGFNLGMDMTSFGFEFMSDDLSKIASSPRITGLRLYARPFAQSFPLAFGVSTIADFNPAEGMNMSGGTVTADVIGNPMFFNMAVDLDLPIVNTDPLRVIGYADFGGMMPYFRTQGTGLTYGSITPGLHTETMFASDSFKNFGFSTGFLGNITFFTYQLEFRYVTGTFKPAFFNKTYDRSSNDLALQTANYVVAPADPAFDQKTLGIYLEGGMKFANVFTLDVGYMLPMTLDSAGFRFGEGEDTFHAEFILDPNVIPVVNLSGSIAYDRSFFVSMITGQKSDTGKTLDFFDEYSVLSGELAYGISKYMDLAFILSTAVARDSSGAVMYESDGITKKIDVTWSIETRIHF